MYKGKRIGVVVPAYNEERFIASVINTMPDFVDEIYVVDDASTDDTYQIASDIASQNGRSVVISHKENRGVGAAIVTGYKKALEENMDIAVVMAGDNQMNPDCLSSLLTPLIEGKADYAKGNRVSRPEHLKGMTNWRRFGNWLLKWLTRIASGNYEIMDPQNGYTAITRLALKRIDLDNVYPWYGYCNDILVKLSVAGSRICEVPIPARYGTEKSKIKYRKYIPKVSMLLLRDFLWRLKIKYLHLGGANLDFTLTKYWQLCDTICCRHYTNSTVADYLANHNLGQRVVVLRHDVDRKPQRALRMAKLEQKFGIKGTYYLRFNKKVFQPELIREIANMGHEIGYHYETLDKAKGDYVKAIQIFEHELNEFRKIAKIKTICMHGNPFTQWVNRDLWSEYDFSDFGLIGEAYLSFENITYLSDTDRKWSTEHKVKDYLLSAASNNSKSEGSSTVTSTDNIIELLNKEQLGPVYLLVHPERWSNNLIAWIADLALDTGVNLAKQTLKLRRIAKH